VPTCVTALSLLVLSAQVPEPLVPQTSVSRSFVSVSEPTFDPRLFELRVLSGLTPVPRARDLDLVYSNLGFSAALASEVAVSASVQSRALLGDPLASMPDRAGLQILYAPSFLAMEALRLALLATGSYGAELKRDEPGRGVSSASLSLLFGGDVGPLRWAMEMGAGWGTALKTGGGERQQLPAHGGVALAVPLGSLEASLEASTRGNTRASAGFWDALGTAGLTWQVSQLARLQLGATAMHAGGNRVVYGGTLGLSGTLGLGDVDDDGIGDKEDACPGASGGPAYYGCPFEDIDADGVWDRLDACPDASGPERNAGCPLADQDGDGLPDIDDPCPEAIRCPET
jgi:hypothetical protein